MLKYPKQVERSREVQEAIVAEFEFASKVFSFWVLSAKDDLIDKSPLSWLGKHIAGMLNLQAVKQFRSIVELCRECETFNANVLARSLYETVLALQFVLRPNLGIEVLPGKGKKKFRAILNPDASLPRDFRAELYRAYSIIRHYEDGKREVEEFGLQLDLTNAQEMAAEVEKIIGPEWTYVLRNIYSYSGLSVADLAKATGPELTSWYRRIYGFQSRMAHGANAIRHIKVDSETRLIEPAILAGNEEVSGTLGVGTAMFLCCVATIYENIDLGPTITGLAQAMIQEYAEMTGGPPSATVL